MFSFKELTEFNMLPGRFNRLPHHVYKTGKLDLLKLNVMYGANGAGKSNMIRQRPFVYKPDVHRNLAARRFGNWEMCFY